MGRWKTGRSADRSVAQASLSSGPRGPARLICFDLSDDRYDAVVASLGASIGADRLLPRISGAKFMECMVAAGKSRMLRHHPGERRADDAGHGRRLLHGALETAATVKGL